MWWASFFSLPVSNKIKAHSLSAIFLVSTPADKVLCILLLFTPTALTSRTLWWPLSFGPICFPMSFQTETFFSAIVTHYLLNPSRLRVRSVSLVDSSTWISSNKPAMSLSKWPLPTQLHSSRRRVVWALFYWNLYWSSSNAQSQNKNLPCPDTVLFLFPSKILPSSSRISFHANSQLFYPSYDKPHYSQTAMPSCEWRRLFFQWSALYLPMHTYSIVPWRNLLFFARPVCSWPLCTTICILSLVQSSKFPSKLRTISIIAVSIAQSPPKRVAWTEFVTPSSFLIGRGAGRSASSSPYLSVPRKARLAQWERTNPWIRRWCAKIQRTDISDEHPFERAAPCTFVMLVRQALLDAAATSPPSVLALAFFTPDWQPPS